MPIDVLCAGLIVADHVCAPIAAFPPSGELRLTDRLELTIGGSAANVAMDLARLGLSPAIGGRIGTDPLGKFVLDVLQSAGVDCSAVTISPTAQTSATMVVNVIGDDRRFIHAAGANVEFTGLELSADTIRQAKVLCIGGFGLNPALSGENVARMFRIAREAGVFTALDVVIDDPAAMPEMLRPVLPWTDLFLPNTDEARMITGETDPLRQASRFRADGARTVVVTCGGRGVLLASPEITLRGAAYPVECVDGTGGGDAFIAGYLAGHLSGEPPRRCLELGSAVGASCVRAMGATTGVFTKQELEEYVRRHPLPIEELPAG